MARRIGAAVALAIVAIAILWWRCRDPRARHESKRSSNQGSEKESREHAVDPRKLARASIEGTIRDELAAPIVGAVVCADVRARSLSAELQREPRCTRSDARGSYKLGELYVASYAVTATAKGFRPQTHGTEEDPWFRLAAGEAKTGGDLVLHPGGVEVTGVVLDVEDGPIAGAWVRAAADWGAYVYSTFIETDKDGHFSLWTFPGGMTVEVIADGYVSAWKSVRAPGSVKVHLTPEALLAGTVVDASTGTPIAGATVSVVDSDAARGVDRSDAHGRFLVRRLAPGRYAATAETDDGFGRTDESYLLGLGETVDGAVIKVHPAARVTGKVVIAGSPAKPCSGGTVYLARGNEEFLRSARISSDGTVALTAVSPGTYRVRLHCDDGRNREKYPPLVVGEKSIGGVLWEVDAAGAATIRGRLRTKSGLPIADGNVAAVSNTTAPDYRSTITRWDGSYEITELLGGTYGVRASVQESEESDPHPVTVAPGGSAVLDIVVDTGGAIHGTIVDTNGAPVPEASVQLIGGGPTGPLERSTSRTDAAGAFRASSLPPDRYRITIRRSLFQVLRQIGDDTVLVKSGETSSVKIVVEAHTATIKGTVVDARGAPIPDAYVTCACESSTGDAKVRQTHSWWGQSTEPTLAAADGTFELTKLFAGTYTVRAYRRGGGEAVATHVKTGSTIRIAIAPTAVIEGSTTGIVDPEIEVLLSDVASGFERRERFYRTGGKFVLRDVPAGSFKLRVEGERSTGEVAIRLAEEETRAVTIPLRERVTLAGRVIDWSTRKPIVGILLRVSDGGTRARDYADEVRTDADGMFATRDISSGRIEILAFPGDTPYGLASFVRQVSGPGTVNVGDLALIRQRVGDEEQPGALGVTFAKQP